MSTKGDILVIDDDPDFCDVVSTTLAENGFAVRCAHNGTDGLAMMRERKPDLVFLDVIMVSPTEGCSVSDDIFDDPELRQVPVVMVTSIVDTEYIGWFPTDRPLHVDLFVEKPVPMHKLLELANRFARQAEAAP
ncbi:MAG TPA: response regulator [Anaerolineae bacterium]|nr:response regulator [Anaerolineae bacterium]